MLFDESKVKDKLAVNEREAEAVIEPEIDLYIPWIDDEEEQTSLFEEKEAEVEITRGVTLVIDADSLIYQACHIGSNNVDRQVTNNEKTTLFDETVNSLLDEQKDVFDSRISSITDLANRLLKPKGIAVNRILTLFTPKKSYRDRHGLKPNFRYELVNDYNKEEKIVYDIVNSRRLPHEQLEHRPLAGYKANRVGMPTPTNVEMLMEWALDKKGAMGCDGCEADDYAYKMKTDDPENILLAVIDKDILKGTPSGDMGHLHFSHNKLEYTSQEEADLFYYRQCMTGDSTDGIPGIYRCGPVKAEAALPEWKGHVEAWKSVVKKYTKENYSEEYAILMMRLVHLGQLDNNNQIVLWEPIENED